MDTAIQEMTVFTADRLMNSGFHCSQCVFPYAAYRLGMDRAEALRLSAGLGGGCFHGDSCGAVTGAILALGLVYGFDQPDAAQEDRLLIARVREFEARFCAAHGACLCRERLAAMIRQIRMHLPRTAFTATVPIIVRRPAAFSTKCSVSTIADE